MKKQQETALKELQTIGNPLFICQKIIWEYFHVLMKFQKNQGDSAPWNYYYTPTTGHRAPGFLHADVCACVCVRVNPQGYQ